MVWDFWGLFFQEWQIVRELIYTFPAQRILSFPLENGCLFFSPLNLAEFL